MGRRMGTWPDRLPRVDDGPAMEIGPMPDLVRLAQEVEGEGAGRILRRLGRPGPGHVFTGGPKTLCTSQWRDTIGP